MKKYIIRTGTGEAFNAASKARKDAETIAARMGYEPFHFSGKRTANGSVFGALHLAMDGIMNWRRLIRQAEPDSIILIQYPHYPMKTALLARRMIPRAQRKKQLRFIALIHDLDSVRGLHGKAAVYSDREMLPLADAIICHNERMKEYLIKTGIPESKLTVLEIFDYLTEGETLTHRKTDGVAVAGNLSAEKSGYLAKLIRESDLTLHLYGKGLENSTQPGNIHLYGSVDSDELPGRMRGGFGLVWDGPRADTCTGRNGEYMRYNNPHKLSLYLSAGMPVIIWREAAEAGFVTDHGLGLTISRLSELKEAIASVSDEQYQQMSEKVCKTGTLLREGAFLRQALGKAEARVNT